MTNLEFGAVRRLLGYSIAELAGVLQVQERAVGWWEHGRRPVPVGVIREVVEIAQWRQSRLSEFVAQLSRGDNIDEWYPSATQFSIETGHPSALWRPWQSALAEARQVIQS